jgi:hypothetical protein
MFALTVKFMVHVPMDLLVFGRAVEYSVAETAAFVGVLLTYSASLHLSLLSFIIPTETQIKWTCFKS